MRPPLSRAAVTVFLFCCFSLALRAQGWDPARSTGSPATVYDAVHIDDVDMLSGNLRLHIPLLHLPGRGLDTDLSITYNSKIWTSEQVYGNPELPPEVLTYLDPAQIPPQNEGPSVPIILGWTLGTTGGWGTSLADNYGNGIATCIATDPNTGECDECSYYGEFVARDGTKIPLNALGVDPSCLDVIPMYGFGGNFAYAPSTVSPVVIFKDGTRFTGQALEDTNGNQISMSSDGKTFTDTIGRIITFSYGTNGLPSTISYLDSGGTSRTITFGYTSYTPAWLYLVGDCTSFVTTYASRPFLTSLTLANGLSYKFQYVMNSDGSTTGELAQVTLPTGGYVKYTYGFGGVSETSMCFQSTDYHEGQNRIIATRTVSSDGTVGTEKTWTYTYVKGMRVVDPLGNTKIVTNGTGLANSGDNVISEIDYENASGVLVKKEVNTTYCNLHSSYDMQVGGDFNYCDNPQILTTTTTLADTNQQSKEVFTYDSYNNATEKDEYDWGSGAPGPLLRKTTYNYLHDTNSAYAAGNVHILDRQTSKIVYDSGGCARAQTATAYDGSALSSTVNVVEHDYTGFPSTYTLRGNVTQQQQWLSAVSTTATCSTSGAWVTTTHVYNDVGDPLQTTDPRGNTTASDYTDNFYNYTPSKPTLAFVTKRTHPATGTVNHIERSQYYFNSGLVAAQCGENFTPASCSYGLTIPQPDYSTFTYDLLNRRLVLSKGDGGQDTLAYNETALPINITDTIKIDTTGTAVQSQTTYDGLGRNAHVLVTTDPDGPTYTDTTYDPVGRKATASNPYRVAGEITSGTTTNAYDSLDRITQVVPPDGSTSSDNVSTVYSGNTKTVADQAGKTRKIAVDALGRNTAVWEANSSGSFVYETDYQYDVLDNLIQVQQKGNDTNSSHWRTRTFSYDSLSRLTSAMNPEASTPAGTVCSVSYTYDPNGNVLTKIAPAPNQGTCTATVTTTYSYDSLNRIGSKSFSNGDQTISYFYDQPSYSGLTIANGVGRRTGMSDAAGTEAWSYDVEGRIATDRRTTIGITEVISYTYFLEGSQASVTYPSGRTVSFSFKGADRPVSAQDNTGLIYATSASYSASGTLASLKNGTSATTTIFYSNRFHPCRISVTTTSARPASCTDMSATGNILDLTYNYDLGIADNGDVIGIINNRDATRTQSFSYDSLDRIQSAQTSATTGANCWGLKFNIDPWGNLYSTSYLSNYAQCVQAQLSLTVDSFNHLSAMPFDAVGNVTSDGTNSYTYDGQNQIKAAAGITYSYDGDGRRVAKSNGKLYWFGVGSAALAESDASGNITNEYVFFNGKRIARRDPSNNVFYYFADHLGSSRTILQAGQSTPCYEADFYPYGGERILTNTCSQNYKFTSKERDPETGLDEFGARYFSSQYGRFMSADWSDEPSPVPYADFADPQTLNLYAYVRNNPLSHADADGHCCDLEDAVKGVVDFGTGFANALLSDNAAGAGRQDQGTLAGRIGAAVGDTVATLQGGVEGIVGGGAEVGGLALDSTGVGSVAGIPVNVAAGGLILHGAATGGQGLGHLFSSAIGPKKGESGGPGAGKPFNENTKEQAVLENKGANNGEAHCVFCGEKVGPGTDNKTNIDHATAKSKGGNNSLNNANVTCEHCNKSKGTGQAPKNPKQKQSILTNRRAEQEKSTPRLDPSN